MTMTATEQAERNTFSRSAQGFRKTRVWHVSGANEPEEAAAQDDIPAYGAAYDDPQSALDVVLRVTDVSVRPLAGRDDLHEVTVSYEYPPPDEPSDPQAGDEWWELQYSPQQTTVYDALEQTAYGSDARAVGLAVNVDDQGAVHGLPAFEGYATLAVKLWKATADVDEAYLGGITFKVPPVNSVSWYGFAAGAVLYGGYRINRRGEDLTEIEFRFLCSPNLSESDLPDWTDIDGGSISVSGGRQGWERIWTQTALKRGAAGSGDAAVEQYTRGVYKSRFYPENDFSALGLSGSLTGS